jgi:hypothetical protein
LIDLARKSEFLTFAANASELEERIRAKTPGTVLIDEVQRLPSLLSTVQAMLDEAKRAKKPLKVFLARRSRPKHCHAIAKGFPASSTWRLGARVSPWIFPSYRNERGYRGREPSAISKRSRIHCWCTG